LNGRFTLTALAVLFGAKLISWWISLGSQTSGGTLAPMFLVGATMGALLGHGLNAVFPGLHVSPAAFALVAMAATFGAATRALLASVVFAAEVTGEFHMIVPMLIGVAFAELVAEVFLTDRLMTEKLSHRGFRVDFRTEVGALRMRLAHHVMRPAVCVPADASIDDVREAMTAEAVSVIAVVDDERHYLGLITAADLDGADGATRATAAARAANSISPISHSDYLSSALAHLTVHGLQSLPVVDRRVVVGQLDRADIVAEHHRHGTALETRQSGWIHALRHRTRQRHRPEQPEDTLRRLRESTGAAAAASADTAR
jgi:CBS domain-containing protein